MLLVMECAAWSCCPTPVGIACPRWWQGLLPNVLMISNPTLLVEVLHPDGVVKTALLMGSRELLPVSTVAAASAVGQGVAVAEVHA
jgi:hypothetical protein